MNGFGIPAGMAGPGYSAYSPLATPASYGTAEPIWLAPGATIPATDISALIPIPDPVWFDWEAPLQLPALPAETVTTPPLPVLTTQIEPEKFGGYVEQPTVYLTSYPISAQQPAAGPIEWGIDAVGNIVKVAGDVVKTGIDAAADLVKFIGENLEVVTKTGTQIGGAAAQYKTAEAQLKAAEAAKIQAQAQLTAAQRPVTPTVTSNLADWLSQLTGVPSEATPPFVQAGTAMGGVGVEAPTNWLLLGALGVGAYFLLRKMR